MTHDLQLERKTADQKLMTGTLYLVDLAGSENASVNSVRSLPRRSHAHLPPYRASATSRAKPSTSHSARSPPSSTTWPRPPARGSDTVLFLLQHKAVSSKPRPHLPYRDSKLTRILKPALDGKGAVTFVATVDPYAEMQSVQTLKVGRCLRVPSKCHPLQFAQSAARISVTPTVNLQNNETSELAASLLEIELLKKQLANHEMERVRDRGEGYASGTRVLQVQKEESMARLQQAMRSIIQPSEVGAAAPQVCRIDACS